MRKEETHRRGRRARRGGGAEGNSTQRHKGTKDTKFRKDRTKVQKRGMANPLLSRTRTFTCTRPQGGGEGNSTQRHKGTKDTKFRGCLGFGGLEPALPLVASARNFPRSAPYEQAQRYTSGKVPISKTSF